MVEDGPQSLKSFGFRSIRWRFIVLITLAVVIGLIATVFGTTKHIRNEAEQAAVEKAKSDLQLGEALLDSRFPGPWAIRDGQLYKGETLMNGNFDIVDEIARLTGDTCTIFQGDTRVATNVIRDGKRAVGTKVSDEVARVVLQEGRVFSGEANVVGVKYQTAYKPIRDESGKIIGIWYVGANKLFVDKMVGNAVQNVFFTFGSIWLVIIGIIWWLTNSLTRPINELVVAANRLAHGDLDTEIAVQTRDEVGYLARSFERMRGELRQQYGDLHRANELLRESERRFREMLEEVKLIAVILDKDGNITFCNDFLLKLTGWEREEVLGRNWFDIFVPEDKREKAKKNLETVVSIHGPKEIQTRSGQRRLIFWNNTFLRDVDGNIIGSARIGEDITDRVRAEDDLRTAHQQLLDIIEFLPDPTFVIDCDRKVIAWNRAMVEMSGVAKEDIIGKGDYAYAVPFYGCPRPSLIDAVFSDRDPALLEENIVAKDTTLYVETYVPSAFQGKGAFLWASASPLYDSNGNIVGAIQTFRDITDRKRIEERLQYLATHDSLTNIPNRYALGENLKRAVARAKRNKTSALLFIDLDNFKIVNDTLGHAAGDELLMKLAGIFKDNLREGDFLARLGGDEFAVLLEDTDAEGARNAAEKLRRAVEEEDLNIHRSCFNLSTSIGIAMIDGTLNAQKLLSYADTAMYAAKEGRNRVVFIQPDEEATARVSETNQMLELIRQGLKENHFVLDFQPVVGLADGQTMHYEVLVRLRGENGKLVYPNRFIPVAERFGLMPQIDRWVVQTALGTMKNRADLNLFINLSAVSLGDETMLDFITDHISGCGINPFRIGFEITETAAVKDMILAERWIRRLKGLGCRFALDDFGVGFSSFSYLRILPIDYLKIDGSYVRDLDADPTHRALVHAMNSVAHTLGKKTVAESVENENVMKILQELKVDCGQGYFLGKPSPLPGVRGAFNHST